MKNKLLTDLKKTLIAEKIAPPLPAAKTKLAPTYQADAALTDEQLLAKAMQGVTPLQLEATAPIHRTKNLMTTPYYVGLPPKVPKTWHKRQFRILLLCSIQLPVRLS